jgi:CheY-like chemotaxis protein
MTTPMLGLPPAVPIPSEQKRKRVLLVDASEHLRDLRAETMRRLGMEVDCAASIIEARCWWRAGLYNLVLINVGTDGSQRDRFCDDVRAATPPQQLAFLVGKPGYLADAPNGFCDSFLPEEEDVIVPGENVAMSLSAAAKELPQRWGILEASRRISAVRSASHARTQAIRQRPLPPRDLENRADRLARAEFPTVNEVTLDDLLKQEMQ